MCDAGRHVSGAADWNVTAFALHIPFALALKVNFAGALPVIVPVNIGSRTDSLVVVGSAGRGA